MSKEPACACYSYSILHPPSSINTALPRRSQNPLQVLYGHRPRVYPQNSFYFERFCGENGELRFSRPQFAEALRNADVGLKPFHRGDGPFGRRGLVEPRNVLAKQSCDASETGDTRGEI